MLLKCAMLKRVTGAAVLTFLSLSGVSGQQQDDQSESYIPDNAPNADALACIKEPSSGCALTAAIKTILSEKLAGEKARVLIAVAEALLDQGQIERAKRTLSLALSEARSSDLSIIFQEKIQSIAPLFVRTGDPASALALVQEARYGDIRDRVVAKIARQAALVGDITTLKLVLKELSNDTRRFWEELNLLTLAPSDTLAEIDLTGYIDSVRALERADYEYRGLILTAILAFKTNQKELADELIKESGSAFSRIVSERIKMTLASLRLEAMHLADMPQSYQDKSYEAAIKVELPRLRDDTARNFARRLAAYEISTGKLERVLERFEYFEDMEERAHFLSRLVSKRQPLSTDTREILVPLYQRAIVEAQSGETLFERDQLRLSLLRGVIDNQLDTLALEITAAMEDDDTQALALALTSSIL